MQYYNNFAEDLSYKPEFHCIFDNDHEGREQAKKIKSYKHIKVFKADLPRYDGALPADRNDEDWAIEDFLPPKVIIEAINLILKKDKYKTITSAQIKQRNKLAHKGTQLLKYCEECTNQNNPNLPPFVLDDQGRKMQICHKFCAQADGLDIASLLTADKLSF